MDVIRVCWGQEKFLVEFYLPYMNGLEPVEHGEVFGCRLCRF